jgi:type IV secretory pathway protease TraF
MVSRHLRQEPQDRQFVRVFVVVSVAVAFAAVVSAAVVYFLGSSAPGSHGTPAPSPASQPVSQQGTLVAVTPDSLTARSSDGFARTYQIDAQTTAITDGGSRVGKADSAFTVNDEVSILAVVRDGKAIATTVAGRSVSELGGPPMDDVAAQPATP